MPEQNRKGRKKYHEVKKITLEKFEKFPVPPNKLIKDAVPYCASGICRCHLNS